MDQMLNVDRYLTQRVGIVRRLLDADLPPAVAERWVAAWEDEAQRRGLDPGDREWWRSAWVWIAQDCGGSDLEANPASALRTDQFRASTGWEVPIGVVTALQRTCEAIAAFRAWLDARIREGAPAHDVPDHEWLRREMARLCAAYEAAVGQGKRNRRRRVRPRTT